jgi:hypothetical protein
VKKKLCFISGEPLSPEIFYDYIDSDPVVPIRIIVSTISKNHLAFLDTGSDGIAIPKDLWGEGQIIKGLSSQDTKRDRTLVVLYRHH